MGTSSRNPQTVQQPVQPRYGRMDLGLEHVVEGIARAKDRLLRLQHPDGYWCGELEADSMLESDYIFMHTLLGTGDAGKMERAVNEILRHQNEEIAIQRSEAPAAIPCHGRRQGPRRKDFHSKLHQKLGRMSRVAV